MNYAAWATILQVISHLCAAVDPATQPLSAELLPATPPPRFDLGTLLTNEATEATVDELRAAATALVMSEPGRARSMIARVGRAAWLPEINLRTVRRFGRTEALDIDPTTAGATSPLGLDTVDDVRYECRASWDLGRLVFNPDELRAQEEALRMADVRMDLEALVIRLYFERRRLQVESRLEPANPPIAEARRAIRVLEIEAELDAITGGAFRRGRTTGVASTR